MTEVKISLKHINQLGQGAFGVVSKMSVKEETNINNTVKSVNRGPSNKFCAVKIPSSRGDLAKIELYLLLKIQHDNVVKLLYYFIPKGLSEHIIIALELVEGGDLFGYMRTLNASNSDDRPSKIMGSLFDMFSYQLFRGLAYCHSHKVCHRDIKPENLLVNPITGILKIADFGCGAEFQTFDEEEHTWYIGTRVFRAPELLLGGDKYGFKVDVWSAAMVMSEMVLGVPVFYTTEKELGPFLIVIFEHLGIPTKADLEDMHATHFEPPTSLKNKKSIEQRIHKYEPVKEDKLVKLLKSILIYSPAARLSAWEACADVFFDSLSDIKTLNNGNPAPNFYNFSQHEVESMPKNVKLKLTKREKT